jgi:gamma-glutamyltranspeptidase / glutathione hydrolase
MAPTTIDWSKIEKPQLVFERFSSRRSVVYGTKGIVASSQPLATEAGLEILRKGGNAGRVLTLRGVGLCSALYFQPMPQSLYLLH